LKFLKIQDGGGGHLENHKNCDISATVWVSIKILTAASIKKLNFKNPRWRTAAILKTVNLL